MALINRVGFLGTLMAGAVGLVHCVSDAPAVPSQEDGGSADAAATDANAGDTAIPMDSSPVDTGADSGPPPTGAFLNTIVLPDVTIGTAVAFAANGDALLGGELSDSVPNVQINGLGYNSIGSLDLLVAKIAPNNGYKWVKSFGGASDDRIASLAMDPTGNAYLVGALSFPTDTTTVTFGTTSLVAKHTGYASYVLKLDTADGHPLWVSSFDSAVGTSQCLQVTVNPISGAVAVACIPRGDMSFVDTTGTTRTVTHASGTLDDIFLVELDPLTGRVAKSMYLAGASGEGVNSLEYDAAGNLYVVGSLASSTLNVHLPATSAAVAFSLARTGTNASATDGYVLKLAASDWSHVWHHVYGASTFTTTAMAGSVDATGNVFVTGEFQNSVDFGLGSVVAAGLSDTYVIKLNAAGVVQAGTTLGGNGARATPIGLRVDPAGNVVVAGSYTSATMTIAGTTFPNTMSARGGFTVKLPPALSTAPLWAKANTCPTETANSRGVFTGGIAIDPTTGQNAIIGSLIGATDFGDGATVSRNNGLFFLRRAP